MCCRILLLFFIRAFRLLLILFAKCRACKAARHRGTTAPSRQLPSNKEATKPCVRSLTQMIAEQGLLIELADAKVGIVSRAYESVCEAVRALPLYRDCVLSLHAALLAFCLS